MMHDPERLDVTAMLVRWANGEQDCLHRLAPLVQDELHRIAHNLMRKERVGHTLQTTAVINEAYARLIRHTEVNWQSRAHFFGVAAHLMRQVLIDHARLKSRQKRGAGQREPHLDEAPTFSIPRAPELLALDEALDRLQKIKPRLTKVVELRYFGGLNVEEAAEVLRVHPNTVIREWALAKAWLRRELGK